MARLEFIHYFYAQVNYQYHYFSYLKWDNAINKIVKHQSQDLSLLFYRELADFVELHVGKEFHNLGPVLAKLLFMK